MSFNRPWEPPRWLHARLVPFGAAHAWRSPTAGELIVIGGDVTHTGEPRRIISVREDRHDGRAAWIIEHTAPAADPTSGERQVIGQYQKAGWHQLPEHYPVCGRCQRLMPCEHVAIEQIAQASAERFDRYATPGVCPACREVVSSRQRSVVFTKNRYGLGDVVFHLRTRCQQTALRYDRDVHADDANYQLHCPGRLSRRRDGGTIVTDCTATPCRGAEHPHVGGGPWGIEVPVRIPDEHRKATDQYDS